MGTARGGWLAVTLGMRGAALVGVLLLLLGNAWAGSAPTMAVLVVACTVQGLGGGVLVAQVYGIVSTFYPDSLKPRVLTMISVAHGLAALVGPIAGGGFAMIGWWRGAFWAAVPVLFVLAGLVWCFLPPREVAGHAVRLPLMRLILLGAAILGVFRSRGSNLEGTDRTRPRRYEGGEMPAAPDSQVIAFIIVAGLLTMTPGADTMLVIRNVMARGRSAGILTALGTSTGGFMHAVPTAPEAIGVGARHALSRSRELRDLEGGADSSACALMLPTAA